MIYYYRLLAGLGFISFPLLDDYEHLTAFLSIPKA
jgi:hypothetical protein